MTIHKLACLVFYTGFNIHFHSFFLCAGILLAVLTAATFWREGRSVKVSFFKKHYCWIQNKKKKKMSLTKWGWWFCFPCLHGRISVYSIWQYHLLFKDVTEEKKVDLPKQTKVSCRIFFILFSYSEMIGVTQRQSIKNLENLNLLSTCLPPKRFL